MAGTTKDYYAILGVERGAAPDQIKKAFRRKARETHPDVAGHAGAEDGFKELNEAYEVLSDPEKRQLYDTYGTADPRMAGGPVGYGDVGDLFGVGDIFETFFGGGGFGGQGRRVSLDGRDMSAQVVVSLEEAATGVEKELRVTRDAPCETCGASGAAEGGSVVTCPDCGGTGMRRIQRRSFLGMMESVTPCQRCGQTGTIADPPCPACGGSGRARREETVRAAVPAGVRDGMSLRVPGMGEAGLRGARAGDLLVQVRVAEHEYLHREGDDLHCHLTLTITQAALGADLGACGIHGDEQVHVPSGSQPHETVRLRGKGMPHLNGGSGDLIVHLAVEVPKKLTKRQKELMAELAESLGDKKRSGVLDRLNEWLSG
ncbi:MAG: molecular chaperone DnaJ [Coriobacteriaceae bacterium]|nr:molecular chaperone DnaJ [Coriobacteriaceae bacterium]